MYLELREHTLWCRLRVRQEAAWGKGTQRYTESPSELATVTKLRRGITSPPGLFQHTSCETRVFMSATVCSSTAQVCKLSPKRTVPGTGLSNSQTTVRLLRSWQAIQGVLRRRTNVVFVGSAQPLSWILLWDVTCSLVPYSCHYIQRDGTVKRTLTRTVCHVRNPSDCDLDRPIQTSPTQVWLASTELSQRWLDSGSYEKQNIFAIASRYSKCTNIQSKHCFLDHGLASLLCKK